MSSAATVWTVARQALLFMGFSRQEYQSGLPCPHPVDLPNPGIKPMSITSPALASRFFTTSAIWEVIIHVFVCVCVYTHTHMTSCAASLNHCLKKI